MNRGRLERGPSALFIRSSLIVTLSWEVLWCSLNCCFHPDDGVRFWKKPKDDLVRANLSHLMTELLHLVSRWPTVNNDCLGNGRKEHRLWHYGSLHIIRMETIASYIDSTFDLPSY